MNAAPKFRMTPEEITAHVRAARNVALSGMLRPFAIVIAALYTLFFPLEFIRFDSREHEILGVMLLASALFEGALFLVMGRAVVNPKRAPLFFLLTITPAFIHTFGSVWMFKDPIEIWPLFLIIVAAGFYPVPSPVFFAVCAFGFGGYSALAATQGYSYSWIEVAMWIVATIAVATVAFLMRSGMIRRYELVRLENAYQQRILEQTLAKLEDSHQRLEASNRLTEATNRSLEAEIDERARAERQLQESESRYRDLFENATDLIQSVDANGRFLYANEAWCDTLGYSWDELSEMVIHELLSPKTLAVYPNYLQPDANTQRLDDVELILLARDGREVVIEGNMTGRFERGELVATRAIFRDVTESRELDRMKEEFVATVSHELRTPLTSIRGSLNLLLGDAAGQLNDGVRQLLRIAHDNSERLTRLVNDILDFQKIEYGQMAYQVEPLLISALVMESVRANEPIARAANISFDLSDDAEGVHINGDRDRLLQAMTNLLSNAIKHSPKQCVVTVDVRRDGDMAKIAIIDRGKGIPDEFRSRIFEKFAQADSSNTRMLGGTGLGLSITKAIVENHEGVLNFESEVGIGTTFFILLPISEPTIQEDESA